MIFALYFYGKSKLNDDEEDYYINKVEEDMKDIKYKKDNQDMEVKLFQLMQ